MRKSRLKLGDIYKIPLKDGQFAYGRLFKENTLAIYLDIFNDNLTLPSREEYKFYVAVYKDLLHDGVWKVVANKPFLDNEEAWAPAKCIIDKISGKYSMYLKGHVISSTKEECEGLERVSAWDRHHVVDRIMGDNKWNV